MQNISYSILMERKITTDFMLNPTQVLLEMHSYIIMECNLVQRIEIVINGVAIVLQPILERGGTGIAISLTLMGGTSEDHMGPMPME